MGSPLTDEQIAEIKQDYSTFSYPRMVGIVLNPSTYMAGVTAVEVVIGEKVVTPEQRIMSAVAGFHPLVDAWNVIMGVDLFTHEELDSTSRLLSALGPAADVLRFGSKLSSGAEALGEAAKYEHAADAARELAVDSTTLNNLRNFQDLLWDAKTHVAKAADNPNYIRELPEWKQLELFLATKATVLGAADSANDTRELLSAVADVVCGLLPGSTPVDSDGDGAAEMSVPTPATDEADSDGDGSPDMSVPTPATDDADSDGDGSADMSVPTPATEEADSDGDGAADTSVPVPATDEAGSDGDGSADMSVPSPANDETDSTTEPVSYPDDGEQMDSEAEQVSYPDDGEQDSQAEPVSYPDDGEQAGNQAEPVSYPDDQDFGYDDRAVSDDDQADVEEEQVPPGLL